MTVEQLRVAELSRTSQDPVRSAWCQRNCPLSNKASTSSSILQPAGAPKRRREAGGRAGEEESKQRT